MKERMKELIDDYLSEQHQQGELHLKTILVLETVLLIRVSLMDLGICF